MTTAEILSQFPCKSALVVGDICLDRWCTYDPALAQESRETGIPRIAVTATETTPGAGGTIANNLAALGTGRVAVLGAIGLDGHGFELQQALGARGIGAELLIQSREICTFTYTKLLNSQTGEEDRPRVDFINVRPIPAALDEALCARLREVAAEFDVVFVSDQAETDLGGVVTAGVRDELAQFAERSPEKVVWVDSRLRSGLFRRVILKPNQDEAAAACRGLFGAVDYARLRRETAAPVLIVTHGSEGALVIGEQGETLVPTRPNAKPVDICGAGDSFSAGAGVALSICGDPVEAARFGNLVASITITKRGTGTASPAEVLAV